MAKLKSTGVSTPPRKLVIGTKVTATKPALKAAPIAKAVVPVSPDAGKPASAPRFVHDVKPLYDGPSPTTNSGKSRTPWKNSQFGSQPQRSLTTRTALGAQALRDAYGANPFKRGNIDSGVANVLIQKGYLKPMAGDGTSEDDTYAFVGEALKIKFASPKAQ